MDNVQKMSFQQDIIFTNLQYLFAYGRVEKYV
jgi:hypothetical protein